MKENIKEREKSPKFYRHTSHLTSYLLKKYDISRIIIYRASSTFLH